MSSSSLFLGLPSSPVTPTPLASLDIPYNLRKRKAEVEPTVESPLTKRFRKLNIRNSGPSKVTKRTASPARNATINREAWNLTPPPFQRPSSPPPAVMEVDDTPYKIFVNDLDSSDDSDPESPAKNGKGNPIIFLSDVEREMSRIPMAVLKAGSSSGAPSVTKLTTARASSGSSMDLILYRPPEKVVDDGGAKKFILEARQRIRMQNSSGIMDGIKSEPVPQVDMMVDQLGGGFTDSPMAFTPPSISEDPDAMVLDDL